MLVSSRFASLSLFVFMSLSVLSEAKDDLKDVCDANAIRVKVNDVEVNLALDTTLQSYIILNPDSARKVGLKGSSFSSAETYVRDKIVRGSVVKTKIEVNEYRKRTRVIWFERNYIHDSRYDGVIGISEIGTDDIELDTCNQNKNSGDRFYTTTSVPFKYQNNRVVIDSMLPDSLQVMLDFNRSSTNIGNNAYYYMLSQGMLKKLNSYAYQEIELGYYLPSRRISLHSPIIEGVTIDSENVFTPVEEYQMIEDDSGLVEGKNINGIEGLVVYGYKEDKDSKFKSFVKLGRGSLPDCRSVIFDLKKKLIKFSCIGQKNE
jgi:hypothetical protein